MKQIGKQVIHIALVGDYDSSVPAHQAIPLALKRIGDELQVAVQFEWIATPQVGQGEVLKRFDGVWCVPASPYRDMHGALTAIRFAREGRIPFLGTCGGFQHALIEYARNHLGWVDAEHGETAPASEHAIITLLSCGLVEAVAPIRLLPGSLIARAYGSLETDERYRCRYGLRKELERDLFSGPLKVAGLDAEGEVRAGGPYATVGVGVRQGLRAGLGMMTKTFALPYYAVIFTSIRTPQDAEGYEQAAQRMLELVQDQPGFLGVESARGEDGLGITVSYWDSEAAILAWKQHPEHREIRERGRSTWYQHCTTRVSKVERNYAYSA